MENILTTLVFGAYGSYLLAWKLYMSLRDKLDNLRDNHLKHIEERLDKLEQK